MSKADEARAILRSQSMMTGGKTFPAIEEALRNAVQCAHDIPLDQWCARCSAAFSPADTDDLYQAFNEGFDEGWEQASRLPVPSLGAALLLLALLLGMAAGWGLRGAL